jgi:cephalosporin-C deacetylase-like acetyl esterase
MKVLYFIAILIMTYFFDSLNSNHAFKRIKNSSNQIKVFDITAENIYNQNSPMKNEPVKFTNIEFQSQGATIRGRLYLPEKKEKPYSIIIMTHGFTATINGMVADNYAEEFTKSGFAVLLYDHLNFGISDGLPRQEMNKWLQAQGYVDALNYVSTLSVVDKNNIALWGDSMSGGEVLLVGAIDNRVKVIVAQVPACGDKPPSEDKDEALFKSMVDYLKYGDVRGTPENTIGPLPVVSFDQIGTPSLKMP